MHKLFGYIVFILHFQLMAQKTVAPVAPKHNTILSMHQHNRIDPYFWMNQRDAKPVMDYIAAENEYAEEFFKENQVLTEQFLNEFEQRINPNDVSAPFVMNQRTFQWKNIQGKDYRQLVQLLENGEERVYFDENKQAEDSKYYALGDFALNANSSLFAFSEDRQGRRNYEIHIRENTSNQLLNDRITQTDGSIVWTYGTEKPAFYYLKKDPQTLREFQVYLHIIGENQAMDQLIYEEKDERFYVSIDNSFDKKYIVIQSNSSLTSEVWLIESNTLNKKPRCFLPRKSGHIYEVYPHSTGFYLLSNNNAPDNKILFSKEIPKTLEACQEILGHIEHRLIEGMLVFENHLVVQTRANGSSALTILDIQANTWKEITFNEPVFEIAIWHNDSHLNKEFKFMYTSFTTPATIYSYDFITENRTVFFEKKLIDPLFSPSNYLAERVWVTATDGTKIPVSLVYKKGVNKAESPVLLYGYGSYGVTIPCSFSPHRLSLLDRGFVYAIAHVRGGKFLGEQWYQNGKMMHKKNTFTDFIDCANWLPANGYGKSGHVYAQGGSAGGLLMGAVSNMSPNSFKGVIAQVPFVDVVTTMLDETIPLTVGEYDEWGNPNEKDAYEYMLSYSPYDQVSAQAYPAFYITTGYHDSQVQYWEPLKWVAKLRDISTGIAPIYFECTLDAGHGGGSGISTERLEIAKEFTFLCALEGIK